MQVLLSINDLWWYFTVLPRLKEQCSNRAIPLKDLLSEKGFDKVQDFIDNLDNVADLKVI